MLKISYRETPSEEKLPTRDKGSVFNRLAGFLFSAAVAALAVYIGAQCIASGVYIKHVFGQMTTKSKSSVLNRLTGFFFVVVVAVFAVLFSGTTVKAQNAVVTGSVPSGPASDQVLRLSLRDAINMALRYNLGVIESGENTQIARGQRLLALRNLLPRVSVGASENVQQVDLATFGFNRLNVTGIPNVVGPSAIARLTGASAKQSSALSPSSGFGQHEQQSKLPNSTQGQPGRRSLKMSFD